MSMNSGFVNLLKAPGMSSHRAVMKLRHLLGIKKIGHLGTLDPLACGVLPLAVGSATKLIPQLPPQSKGYWGEVILGAFTSTDDAEGEILQSFPVPPLEAEFLEREILPAFRGRINQVPPRFSAIHHQGKRLYQLARQNIAVDIPPREVEVYALRLEEIIPSGLRISVECSPGTYIRALARDLGEKLGLGGYLGFLIRTKSGPFKLENSYTYEEIEALWQKGEDSFLIAPEEVLGH